MEYLFFGHFEQLFRSVRQEQGNIQYPSVPFQVVHRVAQGQFGCEPVDVYAQAPAAERVPDLTSAGSSAVSFCGRKSTSAVPSEVQ